MGDDELAPVAGRFRHELPWRITGGTREGDQSVRARIEGANIVRVTRHPPAIGASGNSGNGGFRLFLPVKVLGRVFRGKFVAALRCAFADGQLGFHGNLTGLAQPKTFSAWLRQLFRHDWVVYAKRPFGSPEHVLRYLGSYTHRVAISNHRLVSFADEKVTFRWRDSAHKNKKRLMTLPVEEFLRRFLLHLLPKGFVRIRHFGFLATRQRTAQLPICFRLAAATTSNSGPGAAQAEAVPAALWTCPQCGGPMQVVERLTAAQILLRTPYGRGP